MAMLLFSLRPRHADGAGSCLCSVRFLAVLDRLTVSVRAEGICDMQQLGSLLRATRARIGRRLSLIVAIAAASLPSAGA
jgi:hypothetical protein